MKEKLIIAASLFVVTFIVVLIIYNFTFVRSYRQERKLKKGKIEKRRKEPVEILLLKNYYKVDISKLKYTSVLKRIAFVSSFDISLIVSVACVTRLGLVQILIACVIIFPVIYVSYWLLAKILKRKKRKERLTMNDFTKIEKKWQDYWEKNKTFKTDTSDFSKPKYYALDMFPYPSGQGLHVGHPEGYTATDIMSRMRRMQGYNVLHPIGWDAFGLPAEQYAIKTGKHPSTFTEKNIEDVRFFI